MFSLLNNLDLGWCTVTVWLLIGSPQETLTGSNLRREQKNQRRTEMSNHGLGIKEG